MRWGKKISPAISTVRKIVVTGVEKGVGVTHFSILLAAYYVFVLGKKVCIADLSESDDYLSLDRMYNGDNLMNQGSYIYKIKKINFLVQSGGLGRDEMIRKALEQRCDIIIFDNGTNLNSISRDMVMCDVKYIVGSCIPWKMDRFEKQIDRLQKSNQTYRFVYSFGEKNNARMICQDSGVMLYSIPYSCSPFRVERKQLSEIEKIIWEEEWQ